MPPTPRARQLVALLCFLLAVPATLVAPAPLAEALTVDPITSAGTYTVNGDFLLAGNGVLAPNGTNTYGYSPGYLYTGSANQNTANDTYYMANVDVDGSSGTFNSSRATVTVPQGAKVVAARLVWSGNTGGYGGVAGALTCDGYYAATAPNTSSPSTQPVSISMNGTTRTYAPTGYTTDKGRVPDNPEYYSASADILGMFSGVTGSGSPTTLTVGNIWTPSGYGCYGGWAVQLVYDFDAFQPDQPAASQKRTVYTFDGYARKFSTDTENTTVNLTGLQPQGPGAKFGSIAWEGDASIGGDTVTYSDPSTAATNLATPGGTTTNNYFRGLADGSVNHGGYAGTFYNGSVSASKVDLPGLVASDTSLLLRLGTAQDSYLVTNVVVSVPNADVKITKTALNGEQDAAYAPGSTPSFRITVYNAGSVAITAIQVSDQLVSQCTRDVTQMRAVIDQTYPTGNGYIPAGGSVQYTCTATPTTTPYDNVAKVVGQTGTGIPVSSSNTSKVLIGKWEVTKAPKYVDVPAGTIPTWVFTVNNTGSADIFNIAINDPNAPACSRTIPLVKAGTPYTYECQGPTAITGHTTNGFTATGSAQATSTSTIKVPLSAGVSASDPNAPAVEASSITLTKTANKAFASVGEQVTFTFTARNTGSSTLNTVRLTDPEFPACNQTNIGPLAPGATRTVTCTVTAFTAAQAGTLTNHATVIGTPPSGTAVSASDEVDVNNKSLSLAKKGATTDTNGNGVLDAGDTVAYSFTVTNTGSSPLSGITVADPKLAGATITCTPTTLAPDAAATCTASSPYTVTQSDVDAGTLANTATATGTATDGTTTTGTAGLTLTPVQQPAIDVTKTASPATISAVGQRVTYTFTVTNAGNATLSGVTLTDPLAGLSAITCRTAAGTVQALPASLAPKSALTCTATRTSTQADLDAGTVPNTATVRGTSPKGTVVTDTASAVVTATQTARMTTTKTADKTTFSTVGELVTYTFTTTNTGNVTLSGVAMSDPMTRLADRSCTPTQPATLAPGASVVCTATLTVNQADLDGGAILNTVSAAANPPSGATLRTTASFAIAPAPAPELSLVKTPSRTTVTDAGQVVSYTLVATNNGNTTLSNVQVADTMPGLVMGACTPALGSPLAPGAKMTCSASYTTTQADVDRGSIVNNASATATDSHGTALSATDTRTVTATATPAIQMTKTASPATVNAVGQRVTYTFTVRNTGNVTLSNLALADPLAGLSAITCAPTALGASLSPGASTTCTATRTTTQADLDAGGRSNTATATGTTPAGGTVSSTSTARVTATQSPAQTSTKTANPTTVTKAGTVVTYTVTVRNSGNVSLANLRVADPKVPSLTCTPTAQGGTLAVGATTTCTGTYTATQADMNTGTINNTATTTLTAPSGTDLVQTPSAVVTTTQNPSLSTTKTGSTSTVAKAGDVVTYTVTTRNTGNQTLTGVGITDPMFPSSSPLTCTPAAPATLQPDQTMTCTGSHTVTQAEMDSGAVVNTATARGTSPNGTAITDTASWTASATSSPDFTLAKSANPSTITAAGRTVTYTVVLTNTGNVSLNGATISDPRIATFTSCTPAQGSRITPGSTMTCTGSYTSTQADVDAGSILNTASATATPPTGAALNRTATSVVTVTQTGSLTLAKSATPNRVTAVGQQVTYSFVMTNTGNVTANSLAITDPMAGLSAISCPTTTLAPGTSTTCTATRTTTQADLDQASGTVTNTATTSAKDPQGRTIAPVSSSATVTVTQTPRLAVAKTASPTTVSAVGNQVNYSIVVTNTGNTAVGSVRVADNLIPAAGLTCTPTQGSTLAPGATMTCTGTRAATQADLDAGRIVNTATATGTAPNGSAVTPATAQATVTATQNPAISLTKTPSRTTVAAVGDQITYTYVVRNTGNVTVGSARIADPHPGLSSLVCPSTTGLAPGATLTCTAQYSATQADLNAGSIPDTATASAERPGGDATSTADDLTASASAVVGVTQAPALSLTKNASVTSFSAAGRTITYSFAVQNTGNVDLANVRVTDPHTGLSALTCTPAQGSTLAPQASMNCTASYTTTQADIDATKIDNTATVTATAPSGATVRQSATRSIPAVINPAMSFSKAAAPGTVTTLGQAVTYTFTATNTGNVTMHDVSVADPMTGLSAVTCQASTLAPGASTTCQASYAVTQADLDRGTISNTATLSALDVNNAQLTRTASTTVQATQTARLAIDKKTTTTSVSAVGDVVDYTFTVTNTGNVTASGITVSDPLPGLSGLTCPATTLAPGASMDCTASYTVRQADLDAGAITNTATVRGTGPGGVAITPATDQVKVPVAQNAARTFTKTATPATVSRVGEVVTYTFEVHNTGNVTINNVLLNDPMYQVGMSTQSCNVYAPDGTTVLRACAGAISLAPGEYKRRVATYTVKQSDLDAGTIPNTATLGSTAPDGTALPPLTSSFLVTSQQSPAMTFAKSADTATYSAVGQKVTYSFLMTNTGNVSLSGVQVADPMPGLSDMSCTPALGSTIAPRATMRCTATHTVTQADLDGQSLPNTATATATAPDGSTLQRTSSLVLTAVLTPSVQLAKTVAPATVTAAGQQVTYSFLVTNTGNATLNSVAVADPMPGLSAVSCPVTTLAPEASTTCTATMTVTQAQADAGTVANTATVNAVDVAGTPVSRQASASLRIAPNPSLAIAKSASISSYSAPGTPVAYTFRVTNTGNVTASAVSVADPMNGLSSVSCPATTLAVGESMDCTATYTTKQADIDLGQLRNTATVRGTSPTGVAIAPASSTVTIPAVQQPSDSFTKTVTTPTYAAVGEQVTFELVGRNTGNTTLSAVTIDDPMLDRASNTWDCAVYSATDARLRTATASDQLAPGEYVRCLVSHTVRQGDLDNGVIANTATMTANAPGQKPLPPVSGSAVATAVQQPALAITKTADTTTYSAVGQQVTYTYTLTNTGNVSLADARITDPHAGLSTLNCTPAQGSPLAPRAVMRCTASYAVTQADLDGQTIVNTATGSATDPTGAPISRDVVRTIDAVLDPSVTLTKTATPNPAPRAGSQVTYSFLVTNTGNATLNSVAVTDPMPGLSAVTCPTTTLAPKASTTCTATMTVSQAQADAGVVPNTATVTGVDAAGTTVSRQASTTLRVTQSPQLTLDKSVSPTTVTQANTPVTYTFVVTNSGNVTVNDIAVTDPLLTQGVSCPVASLAPGASTTCTAPYVVNQDEVDAGGFTNSASVTGTTSSGAQVTPATDSATVTIPAAPARTFTKTSETTQVTRIGQVVTYTLTTTNTGNVTLDGVFMSDPQADSTTVTCRVVRVDGTSVSTALGPVSLAPGEQKVCQGTHTFTQAEFEVADPDPATTGIDFPNTARSIATAPGGAALAPLSATHTVYLQPSPDFQVTKTANTQTYSTPGQTITYSVRAVNSGNVALHDVRIIDQMLANVTLSCSPTAGSTLQPGEAMLCTGQYVVTQDDVDRGSITNQAWGRGIDGQGVSHDSTAPGTLVVNWEGSREIALSKTATPSAVSRAGEPVTYTFTVLNPGDVSLTNIALADPHPGLSAITCPATTLGARAQMDCTATYTTTQADIDAGGFDNTATVTALAGNVEVTTEATTRVQAAAQPSVTLAKSGAMADDDATADEVGDVIDYSFVVTNTGNLALDAIAISDSRDVQGLSCPASTLAPLASMTCTATYTVTQADLNSPAIVNTATVQGTDLNGTTVTADARSTTRTTQSPAMTLTKTAAQPTVDAAGTVETYTFVATNTGNVSLYNVVIADPLPGLSRLACGEVTGPVTLDPGQVKTCTATRTITQADMDAGSVPNTATVTSTTPLGAAGPRVTASSLVTAQQTGSLAVTKQVDQETYSSVGTQLGYTIVVTNTGNTTVSDVQPADSLEGIGELACTPQQGSSLAPGAAMTCHATYQVTQADLDALSVTNTASATGTAPTGTVQAASEPVVSNAVLDSDIDLVKTSDRASVDAAGQTITYTFVASNTGSSTLQGVSISDPMPGLSALDCAPALPASLAPGETLTCTATHAVTQAEIDAAVPEAGLGIENTATVTATDAAGAVVDDQETVMVQVNHDPSLSLAKTADKATVSELGETITYSFVITNTGNVRLDNGSLVDPMLSNIVCDAFSLEPGEQAHCTGSTTVTQAQLDAGSINNTAVATATDPDGDNTTSAQAQAVVDVDAQPAMTFDKTVTPEQVSSVGEATTYTFLVTNTGNVSLGTVTINDPMEAQGLGNWICVIIGTDGTERAGVGGAALRPGEAKRCTATRAVTQADLDAGSITNTGRADAVSPEGPMTPLYSSAVVQSVQEPAIEVIKSVDAASYSAVGDVLTYTIGITNTGNTTVTDVQPADDQPGLGPISCDPAAGSPLTPGQTMTCTAAHTVTQADLDALTVVNTASATADGPGGQAVEDTSNSVVSTAVLDTSLDLVKSADTATITHAGQRVTYTFVVTNTGSSTLRGATVTDALPGLSAIDCGTWDGTLAPDASGTCTATYTVTQADIDSAEPLLLNGLDNVATATAVDAAGTSASDTDQVTVQVQHAPAVELVKQATPATISTVGERIDYTFQLTNTGNVRLIDIELTDPVVRDLSCPATSLDQGASMTCTASLVVEQHHLDQGSIPNTATVHANDVDRSISTANQASFTVLADQRPAIELTKQVAPQVVTAVGEPMTYTMVATNTGNVTLANVLVTDPLPGLSALDCGDLTGAVSLEPGQVKTCTATRAATQADVDAGSIVNSATVTAIAPAGALDPVSAGAVATVEQTSSLAVAKTVDKTAYGQVGEQLQYGFTVTNTGNTSLSDVQLTDPLPGLDALSCTPALGSTLGSGQTMNCTATHEVTQADLDARTVVNTATAQGTTPAGERISQPSNQVVSSADLKPAITLAKHGEPGTVTAAGEQVRYTFTVENTGNATLDDVAVTDAMEGLSALTCDQGEAPYRLVPGQEMVCTATYTVTQADIDQARPDENIGIDNAAKAVGTDSAGTTVDADATATVQVQHSPALSLAKSVDRATFSAVGDVVTYSFVVTNTGNVTMHGIQLDDPLPDLSDFSCSQDLAGELAPGQSLVCTASKTMGQAQLDAGTIPNTATVTGLDPEGAASTPAMANATVRAAQNPSMTLTKSSDITSTNAVGDLATYTITMVNTGNVTLANVRILDPIDGRSTMECHVTGLDGTIREGSAAASVAPKESKTCTTTRPTTQADLDRGSIPNMASATAVSPDGSPQSVDSNPVIIQAVQDASVSLVKTVQPTRVAAAGDTVTYQMAITNNGTVTLSNLQLTDTMAGLSPLRCESDLAAPLAPGQTLVCEADKVVSADEMNMATIDNTATVVADAPTSPASQVTSSSTATLIPVHNPRLELTKTHDLAQVTRAGEPLVFTFQVTNTGNIEVTQVAIDDPMLGDVEPVCQATTLAVGESTTCTATYTVTQADVDAGVITNEATVTGIDPVGGDPVVPGQATDTVPVVQDGQLSLTKTGRAAAMDRELGSPVTFDIVATNTGNVTLSDVSVMEDREGWGSPAGLLSLDCDPSNPATLAPGEQLRCVSVLATTQEDRDFGSTLNWATATGRMPSGEMVPLVEAEDKVPVEVGVPELMFTKTPSKTSVAQVGEVVDYTFLATNTGTAGYYEPMVVDPMPGLSAITCDHTMGTDAPLQPGETVTCRASYTVTQADLERGRIDNTATFSGVTASDFETHTVDAGASVAVTQQPDLRLVKTADRSTVEKAGDQVRYSFDIRNDGNVALSQVGLDDGLPGLGELACVDAAGEAVTLPASLEPGRGMVCQAVYVATQADVDSGSITNTATATGRTSLGASVESTASTAVVGANRTPGLDLVKSADRTLVEKVGDRVTFTITATNTGNVSILGATISDAAPYESFDCTPAAGSTLAPGATMTCTGSYLTRHEDLEQGRITNVATFAGTSPDGTAVAGETTSTVPALYDPRLAFDKQVVTPAGNPDDWHAGQTLTYTFHVANVGNMDAHNVVGRDSMADLSDLVCYEPAVQFDANGNIIGVTPFGGPVADMGGVLQPGEFVDCRATYTIKQVDVDRGLVTNTATLTAQEATGDPFPTLSDTVTTTTNLRPVMAVDKSADVTTVSRVGEQVRYSFDLLNNGWKTLSGLRIIDEMPGLGQIDCQKLSWAPGETNHCTATYTVTQADLDRGYIDNTVTASARGFLGYYSPEVSDSVGIDVVAEPELQLTKQARTSLISRAGEVVSFDLVTTNTGNVTAHDVQVSDPTATITGCDQTLPATLAPGESLNCTATQTATQDDVNRGRMTNTATATGLDPQDGAIGPATATSVVPAQRDAQVQLTKVADRASYTTLGEQVTWTMTATNTGNTTLEGVTIDDPLAGLSALSCTPGAGSALLPDQTMTCTATRAVTQADLDSGEIANRATVRSDAPGGAVDDPTDDVTATTDSQLPVVSRPSMSLTKTADTTVVDSTSDVVRYTFVATNTGNVTLHDVVVADPRTAQGMEEVSCPTTVLAPGEQMTCTASLTPAQIDLDAGTIPNTATVTGVDPFGTTTEPAAGSSVVAVDQLPAMEITKTADHTLVTRAGEPVLYTFIGTNTGNVSLHVVEITDPLPGLETVGPDGQASGTPGMTCYPELPADLPPGDKVICRAWYETTQADLDRGSLNNTATITGQDPASAPLPPKTDGETIVTVPSDVRMYLTKQATVDGVDSGSYTSVGQRVDYHFVAGNPGNQTLHDVTLSDPLDGLGQITCRDAAGTSHQMPEAGISLAPGQQLDCTASYTITQADLDRGELYNLASMDATQGGTQLPTVQADKRLLADQSPAYSFTMTPSVETVDAVGDPVTYTMRLTNVGNTSLTGIDVIPTLDELGPVTWTVDGQVVDLATVVLAPGQVLVGTTDHITTQADLDRGQIVNDATSTVPGLAPQLAQTIVKATQRASVELTKTTTAVAPRAGETIDYTIVASNTGSVTATVSDLREDLAGLGTVTCEPALPARLAPGEATTCTASYLVTPADAEAGTVVNTAGVTATDPQGQTVPVADASVATPVTPSPSASLDKQAQLDDTNGDGLGSSGETVHYTLTVRNTGDVSLVDLALTDPMLPTLDCAPAVDQPLAPGAIRTCTGSHVITEAEARSGELANTATLQGAQLTCPDDDGTQAGCPTTATATVETSTNPSMVLDKAAHLVDLNGDELANPGETVEYTLVLRNTGDVTLDEVSVSDPMVEELSCEQEGPLAAGAQRVCTGSHVVTEAEARSGSLVNVATATSPQVDSPATGTVTIPTKADERVTVAKTAQLEDSNGDGLGQPGERIDYSIVVTNAGDVTLDEVSVSDPMLAQLDCSPKATGPLAPGESLTCTGSHVVTEAEAAAGSVVNVATATGPQIEDTTGTATVPTAHEPIEPSPSPSPTPSPAPSVQPAPAPSPVPTIQPAPAPQPHSPGAWIARTGSNVQPWHLLVGLLLVASGVILMTTRKKKEKK